MSRAPESIDYGATATRPQWADLPPTVRTAIGAALGAEVIGAGRSAGSGFTRGFAAPLQLADRREVFVKAAPERFAFAYRGYQREAEVVPPLPPAVRVPRIVAATHAEAGDEKWYAVASELIPGRMPGNPWTAADFALVTAHCETVARALTPSPIDGLGTLAADLTADDARPGRFALMRDGDLPVPLGFQPWLPDRLTELADLADSHRVALTGGSAAHGDLRPDNLIIDAAGNCWTVDWNWLSLGPVWTDWVGLLPAARHVGIDVATRLAGSPLTAGVDRDDLDCFAAVVASSMLARFDRPLPSGGPMPSVHRHQRLTAWLFLDWLADRRGW